MSRRTEGRDETIIDPDLPIIDSHHHLFNNPNITYSATDYAEDAAAGHRIIASVYVDAHSNYRENGPEHLRPIGEVEFANAVGTGAAEGRFGAVQICAGIVGHADLRFGSRIGELLDQAMEIAPTRFRGIRQTTMDFPDERPFRFFMSGKPPFGILEHPMFREGFAELGKRGLTFDAAAFYHRMPDIAALAEAFPDTTIILNNMGIAMALDMDSEERAEVFATWRSNLQEIARRPNVMCKVSGLGMPFWGFGLHEEQRVIGSQELAEVWRPYIETALEAFGCDRCMAGSNYPPDSRSAGFVPLWNALKLCSQGLSHEEKAALFWRTASKVYDLELSGFAPA